MEHICCLPHNAVSSGSGRGPGFGVLALQGLRIMGRGLPIVRSQSVAVVDVYQQIHQAARPLYPLSRRFRAAARVDIFRIFPRPYQAVRCLHAQRGKFYAPCDLVSSLLLFGTGYTGDKGVLPTGPMFLALYRVARVWLLGF